MNFFCSFSKAILLIIFVCVLHSCKKQEKVYEFTFQPPAPPATEKDTVITVSASLNGSNYKALGRALQPDSVITISFYEIETDAYLEVVLGGDTSGVYNMGKIISTNTAVYYKSYTDKLAKKGFTSRATDSAGGYVRIDSIDRETHRLKGTFELRLRSRTDTNKYNFKTGSFDIPYNYATMKLDDLPLTAVKLNSGLDAGIPSSPLPFIGIEFPDSLELTIAITSYIGVTKYTQEGNNFTASMKDNKHNINYNLIGGSMNLIRFNYREFIQAKFDLELQSDAGEKRKITGGSLVLGNFSE